MASPPPNFEAKVLMCKGKRATAAYLHADCTADRNPQHLKEVLDNLLNPGKPIDEWETIDWCKWLMAGGRTPDEFATIVRDYDNATTCGLVWTPNFVAYRCRTCGISPCMSLCTDCFKKGNHLRHDFNMFLSQAGGACDCGDTSVMKETGFCDRHGPNKVSCKGKAPRELMSVAEAMMPRIILRLVQHLRDNSSSADAYRAALQEADAYLTMLLDFNNMGGLMRKVMTAALTNPAKYKLLNEIPEYLEGEYATFLASSKKAYEEALRSLPGPVIDEKIQDMVSLVENLVHKTFLEELVFWTVKFEFPQKVVCLLLNMLPDPDYKEALTRAFVMHYSRISVMLEQSTDPDTLSNRVVHVSVQLFSNEGLAVRMTEQLNLLHIMVISLRSMMSKVLIRNTLHHRESNYHQVVDCEKPVMKDHCYWPLVSDLNNVLSHRPVALKFMSDDTLLTMWFSFLRVFQGMNVNQREVSTHIEFEPNTYYAAFSAELEASAYPMWALVTHLTNESTASLTKRVISACYNEWCRWLEDTGYTSPAPEDMMQVSFHLPLHRYLSIFLCQGIAKQGIQLDAVLPSSDTLLTLLIMHPLRIQVAFYEILNGLWVRNGLQIKGQAMTYIQCNFCNSMVDADIYLLQICCTKIKADRFISMIIDQFHIRDFLSVQITENFTPDNDPPMLESCLTFLATLISVRANMGLSDTVLNRLEMVTLLCMGNKTHSQLMELMPERCGTQSRDFESLLAECADYKAPSLEVSGNMQQGMYIPKSTVWENLYDPIHILLRAVHRRDFQNSIDRYTEFCRQTKKIKRGTNLWPPFRTPVKAGDQYIDPRNILTSKVFHAMAFIVLYKAVNSTVSEQVMALIVFLLEQAVNITIDGQSSGTKLCSTTKHDSNSRHIADFEFCDWFQSDYVFDNFRTIIPKVFLQTKSEVFYTTPIVYNSGESDGGEDEVTSTDSDENFQGTGDNSPKSSSKVALSIYNRSENDNDDEDDVDDDVEHEKDNNGGNNVDTGGTTTEHSPNRNAEDMDLMVYPIQLTSSMEAEISSPPGSPMEMLPTSNVSVVPRSYALVESQSPFEAIERRLVVQNTRSLSTDRTISSLAASRTLPYNRLPAILAGNEIARQGEVPGPSSSENDIIEFHQELNEDYEHSQPSTSRHGRKRRMKKLVSMNVSKSRPSIDVNESIISLLLKLHSALTGIPDSFNPDDNSVDYFAYDDDKVPCGDGTFYVGKLLKKIAKTDEACYNYIQETRRQIWPSEEQNEKAKKMRENKEREERKKKAHARQEKIKAEFARKQEEFLRQEAKRMDTDETPENMDESETPISKQEYDCIICNTRSPSTEKEPMGLVALIQATSIIGHKRKYSQIQRATLPTRTEENEQLRRDDTLGAELDRRVEELNRHFDPQSWFLSINTGWDGGIHVQTCGHHLHLTCFNAYVASLKPTNRGTTNASEVTEYFCPLCRQLGNTFLPLTPEYGDKSQMVRAKPNQSMPEILEEISSFLNDNEQKPGISDMIQAIGKVMADMSHCTQVKPLFRSIGHQPVNESLLLFITSVARTNLEVELIQRGGSLVISADEPPNPLLPKRDCIVPLLYVVAVHARVAKTVAGWSACIFRQLCGLPPEETNQSLTLFKREVPLLLKDPLTLFLQFVLLLPLHLDQTYFTVTVQMVYNLLYYQIVAQVSCGLSSSERSNASRNASDTGVSNLRDALYMINQFLEPTDLYMDDDDNDDMDSGEQEAKNSNKIDGNVNILALEQQVQKLCLPFLRIASLLKYHLYQHPLPEIRKPESEFVQLVYYLDLITESMDWDYFNASIALNWSPDSDMFRHAPQIWCNEYASFVGRSQIAARSLLIEQHALWNQPRLLALPREYERLFSFSTEVQKTAMEYDFTSYLSEKQYTNDYYHEKPCNQCLSVAQETTICLLCGTIICLKQSCCKQENVCEAVQHARECGSGTAVLLVITSTCIIIIRGSRACLWGSLYLDEFEEEDRDLKRGKPLYLSKDRYQLLEQQWLAHRFDHTKRSWVLHHNSL